LFAGYDVQHRDELRAYVANTSAAAPDPNPATVTLLEVVRLLFHCCSTVVPLLFHCCSTVVPLLFNCSYTVVLLLLLQIRPEPRHSHTAASSSRSSPQ
jgi:hypothetical protein